MNRARREEAEGLTYWTIGLAARPSARAGVVDLLPIYDEYLVAYRDRLAVPHGPPVVPPRFREAVIFQHAIVIDGRVAGTWRTSRTSQHVQVDVFPFEHFTAVERRALTATIRRYDRFLGVAVEFAVR